MGKDESIKEARNVLKIEAESILSLVDRIDENFSEAVEIIYQSQGRVIITGIGKSGLIGRKIVATLTSTGTPALFIHPVEGMHGDLGIVTKNDVMLAISNSGETFELNTLISSARDIGVPLIAFTGNTSSALSRMSDVVIDVGVEREACPFGLVPTSSTTASLAMGDALAAALIKKRNFSEQDFRKFHPGGTLGQRLLAKVRDVMINDKQIPSVFSGTPVLQAIDEIDKKNLGFVIITDRETHLLGILTDGDVRRCVKRGITFKGKSVDDLMTKSPKTIDENMSIGQTIEAMEKDEITTFLVVNTDNQIKGYIHLHDILGRGGTLQISISQLTE
jgi:arabinose-5-phosphate isomerase